MEKEDLLIDSKRELAYLIRKVEGDAENHREDSKERADLLGFRSQLRLELSQLWGFCK